MLVDAYKSFRRKLGFRGLPTTQEFRRSALHFLNGRSFDWHPLGFAKLTLAKGFDGPGSSLQVHLWTTFCNNEMPHSHSNILESYVVTGSIQVKIWNFDEDEGGQNSLFNIHHGYNGTREYILSKRGNVRLGESFPVNAGNSYRIEPDALHTTSLTSERACTLVVRSGLKDRTSMCVDPDQSLADGKYLSRTLDRDESILFEDVLCSATSGNM